MSGAQPFPHRRPRSSRQKCPSERTLCRLLGVWLIRQLPRVSCKMSPPCFSRRLRVPSCLFASINSQPRPLSWVEHVGGRIFSASLFCYLVGSASVLNRTDVMGAKRLYHRTFSRVPGGLSSVGDVFSAAFFVFFFLYPSVYSFEKYSFLLVRGL